MTKVSSCGSIAALRTEFNNLRADLEAVRTGDGLLTTATVVVGTSSAAAIKHSAFEVRHNGVSQIVATAEIALDSGTADDIPSHATNIERTFTLSVDAAGSVTVNTGALGIVGASAVPATPAGEVLLGMCVLQAPVSGAEFVAATDNLNVAQDSVDAVTFSSQAVEVKTSSDLTPF